MALGGRLANVKLGFIVAKAYSSANMMDTRAPNKNKMYWGDEKKRLLATSYHEWLVPLSQLLLQILSRLRLLQIPAAAWKARHNNAAGCEETNKQRGERKHGAEILND